MGTERDVRYRAIRAMKLYDRSKLADIDNVIRKFKGNESSFIDGIVKNYGPLPPNEPLELRVTRILRTYDPASAGTAGKIVAGYKGKLDADCIDDLTEKYGPEQDIATPRGVGDNPG